MKIDFHIHLTDYQPMTQSLADFLRLSWGNRLEWMIKTYASPEKFLALMDEAQIDYAVILADISPAVTGIATNEATAKFCSASDRLIPFANLNPYTCSNMAGELQRLTEKYGFRGIKMYPTYQYFYPNDAIVYPLYAKAQELGLPISFHTGSSTFAGAKLKYGDPLFLDDVAVDFPDLVLLQCHCGRPIWYEKALAVTRLHPNIHMEISGLPPKKLLEYFPGFERLSDRVVYGSDWPGVSSLIDNAQAIENLPIGADAKKKILGENAAKILKIGV
ncbi:MAG: amidohydrolase family protein [Desulfobacterales bacterium]|jgi:predicted TIM-barrel fold metal-dependent hydrolase|nr:amidohydrolase family protein [Desulfobacterales bacterium]